jgi:predicted TPR repeat methyltransferase
MPRSNPGQAQGAAIDARYLALLDLYHRGDAFDELLGRCRSFLDDVPEHAGVLQLMGVLQARRGEFDAAVELLDRALAADPGLASACNNRGHALLALHQHARALASYDRAIELGLESADALNNRGTALQTLMRPDQALASFERAVALDPGFAAAHRNRGELLLELGEREAGIAALRRARELGADADEIGYTLASLGAEAPADVAPAAFVRELFDGYAKRFDRHLVERLDYRVPQLVDAAVAALGLPATAAIVDLGCGTGLCAPLLRPRAARLDGVDLSNAMLERAHRLQLYDELVCGELVEYLQARPAAYDLAVAADVLIYFGELAEPLAAVHRSLRPQGWFVFTIEAGETAPYELRATRRYAHARGWVLQTAAAQGFEVQRCDDVVLRTESRSDVAGHLLVLRRPA